MAKRIFMILLILISTISIDQFTKKWAVDTLKDEPPSFYMDRILRIDYAENTGAFLGTGSDLSSTMSLILLKILPLLVLLGITGYVFYTKAMPQLATIAFSLVLGGGFSNVTDRFLNNGAVVDFMNMGIGGLRTGIFNFADVFIMLGIFLLLLSQITLKRKDKPIEQQF